jgi:hypothetical protein
MHSQTHARCRRARPWPALAGDPVMFLTPSALREYRRYRRNRWNRRLTLGLLLALIVAIALGTHSAAPTRHRTPAPAACTITPTASSTTRQADRRDDRRQADHAAEPPHRACDLPSTQQDR